MKLKFLAIAVIVFIVYSCGPKMPTPVTEVVEVPLTPELAEGKDLYQNNCAKCHKLYKPESFDKVEWKKIMISMQKKAKIDDAQSLSIYNYVTANL